MEENSLKLRHCDESSLSRVLSKSCFADASLGISCERGRSTITLGKTLIKSDSIFRLCMKISF